jgi:hypothetical protein
MLACRIIVVLLSSGSAMVGHLNPALLDRQHRQLSPGGDAGFRKDIAQMNFDRVVTQEETLAHLAVGEAFRDKLRDLQLAVAQGFAILSRHIHPVSGTVQLPCPPICHSTRSAMISRCSG